MLIRTACCGLGLLFAVAGCRATDPYERIGLWRPNGSNDANLRRMVAVPSDLVIGTGDGNGNGQQAVAALDRLRTDKVKALPDTGVAQITVQSSGAAPATSQ